MLCIPATHFQFFRYCFQIHFLCSILKFPAIIHNTCKEKRIITVYLLLGHSVKKIVIIVYLLLTHHVKKKIITVYLILAHPVKKK